MSRTQSRWRETLVNCKTSTAAEGKGRKDLSASAASVSGGGPQAGSSTTTPCGRSGDLTSGGSLKRGSLSQPTRAASRLCSSRSFSSLHTSSLAAVPFMRSSRSLNRLDQRSSADDHASSHLKKKQKKVASSDKKIRDNKDQVHGDGTMKTKSCSESSSCLVPTTACHHRCDKVKKQDLKPSVPDVSSLPFYRRLQSLKCRNVETPTTPDVVSCNKGWLMQQDASGQWQKHWFVLTDHILRFYKDSVSEEAADLDGEINLSTCFNVTNYPTQKNCGFQIHTRDGVYTLCTMTSGSRSNWVQAVLKNVKPNITSSLSEEKLDTDSAEVVQKAENQTSPMHELSSSEWAEDSYQQQNEQEKQQGSADGNSAPSLLPVSTSPSSAPAPINPPCQVGGEAACHQCPLAAATQTGVLEQNVTNASSCVEGAASEVKATPQSDNITSCERTEDKETLACAQQTGQLVRELEKTQKELSRLQQLNQNLQDELREIQSRKKNDLVSNSSASSDQAFQQLQKINHDLHAELEAQKRRQEEAREAELRRRVDLLAQQAQLLVTGDATALAQAHLEQDRRQFHEQQVEWERCMASLKSQLTICEEKKGEAETRVTQLQQELQVFHNLQREAENLQKHLQEVTTQLRSNEEAQVQKEARLQKHLMLLQASQDRERRSLGASLAQAEQHAQDLQERLNRAEQQVESLNKSQMWTREIEEAQQQLQDELTRTMSAVEKLQEERQQLERRCQELQNQLSEADGEVSRLQSRLKTDETHYYNLEHSYEKVCEELQLALGKVQQRETETQDIREGYEKLLDRKEQELSEVLLKMEVLGNSLEETEVKLNEVSKVCTCASSHCEDESKLAQHNDSRLMATASGHQSNSSNRNDWVEVNGDHQHARTRSRSIDPSYQYIVTAGDDAERFVTVIQLLETKLYVTEEKLRDITQRLEEQQNHISCQDPHLCSQLTQSRATAQHLSLLLHSQAKQSQGFAQETEGRCRRMAGTFQVALNIVKTCSERLQGMPFNTAEFEKQLATIAGCLQQGWRDAEKLQHESYNSNRGGNKILNDETLAGAVCNSSTKSAVTNTVSSGDSSESVSKCLIRELFLVEKMVSVLQSRQGIEQLYLPPKEDEGGVAHKYKNIISQRIALTTGNRTSSGGEECDSCETLDDAILRVCAEAELIYVAVKFQQKCESGTQNKQEEDHQSIGLADISPPELAPYEEQEQEESTGLEKAAETAEKEQFDEKNIEVEKEADWLERLLSRLQRKATFLHQLCQEFPDDDRPIHECIMDHGIENNSAIDLNWMQENAKLIYLSERLYLDLERELQQSEVLQSKVQDLEKDQDITLVDEQEALNRTVCELQEDNSMLREELERAEQKVTSVESGNQRLIEDIQKIEDFHEERMQKLETEFQEKIRELQQIHEEEMKHLHGHYTKSCVSKERQTKSCTEGPPFTESNSSTSEEIVMERKAKDFDHQKMDSETEEVRDQASCDQGFTEMEEMHRKLIDDLQQQHQTEVAALLKEKDQLLQEETAATMAAIVAMRRAHKQELEKYRKTQHIRESADITELHIEYEREIQLLHKELESLSVQHTQKCLENSQLSQELQGERKLLTQYQQENQELKEQQRETDEMSHFHCSSNGEQSCVIPHINDFYEMEVILRAREAEMQFLRQEARSLREELKIARMDKIYAQNKLKALYKNGQEEPHHDVNKPSEDIKFATWSPNRDASGRRLKDTMTNTCNAAFPKKTEKSSLICKIRGVRSKSLKEGLSVQERMKLFDSF